MAVKNSNSNAVTNKKDVLKKLDALYKRGIIWNKNNDRTNLKLYGMFEECHGTFHNIKGQSFESEVIKVMNQTLIERGFVESKHPKIINLIVRYVFNTESRRVHSYARALNIAISEGVETHRFALWVAEQGGIDELASSKGKTEATIQRNAVLVEKKVEARQLLIDAISKPLATIAKDRFTDRAGGGEYTLLIGKTIGNNKTNILSTVPDVSSKTIDTMIKRIATAILKDEKTNAAKTLLDNRNAAVDDVLKSVSVKTLASLVPARRKASNAATKVKAVAVKKKKAIAVKKRATAA